MGGLLGTKARRRYLVLVLIAFAVAWSTGSLPWSKREAQPVLSAQSAAPIHVLFTASGSYTIGLTALINSTISNASPATRRRLLFHLVAQTHADVEHVLETVHMNLKLAELRTAGYALDDLQDPRLDDVKVWADYRSASLSEPIVYARYLVPSILPTSVDRAIYLDQDTLVQRDIADLWEIDLEGFPLAAARLCRPSALWGNQLVMEKEALEGFNHDTCTLNNGVLLYDLKAWREHKPSYTDQLFEWTHHNAVDQLYSLGSQPPFNLVFYRNYKILDNYWNLMDIAGLHEVTAHGNGLPSTKSHEQVHNAGILHWNGVFKPWTCGGEGYYSHLWTNYFPTFADHVREAQQDQNCRELIVTNLDTPSHVEKFTVVIVSFARADTLVRIARHLEHSDYVKEVIVAWNNQQTPCPDELYDMPWVRCIQQSANLVHNRFRVHSYVTTEAVLHYDDDILVPLADVEAAFHVWQQHRNQVLGFEPRVVVCDGDDEGYAREAPAHFGSQDLLPSNCRYRFKLTHGYFDLVIGKLFFVHRLYMQSYFSHPKLVALSNDAPCEDLAMSFLVAGSPSSSSPHPTLPHAVGHAKMAKPPLLFQSNITEIHSETYAGLSQGIDTVVWREKRHSCLENLLDIFDGHRPPPQRYFYTRDEVRERVYRLLVEGRLEEGWCSDVHGSRVCRQP